MAKKVALLGDSTSNGKVMTATANFYSNEKRVVQDGDMASCSACKGLFPLIGTARYLLSGNTLLVQDQDRVNCQCSDHKVYASGNIFTG
ncbi:hypothetical protein CIG19_06625 [Enterobacterales bacterium CwR94]|nr:hypothetical protein CIG19_06625 [Enterobacterales bacterium CwR94]